MLTCPACGRANPADASFCMGCAAPLGATASARAVRKTVTALFCDLVGSTTLGEQHDPEVLRPLLHAYFEEMRTAVERHGGRVEKYIGDAVSAVFGLPVIHEDDALRAVRAGLEMIERLAALNANTSIPLACRVGVSTGEVLVPTGGEPLIGDTMNTAARLQGVAEPGFVVIGEATYGLVRDAVVATVLEPLTLKGKAEPVPAYRVQRVAPGSPMRTRRLDAPMVGRTRESALLANAFERAASDRACQLFTVLGSAGAGKSRLAEEFLGSLAGTDVEILRGRCLPYGEGITWFPVTEAVRGALGLPDFADEATIRETLAAAVQGEQHATSIHASLRPLFAAGAGGTAEETAWAIRSFLESRGRERPVVVVFEDIHWGEDAFLDLVEHVADWSRDSSILLLCMARPDLLDARPAWGGGKTNATTISLAPLSDTECGDLMVGLLGSPALPSEMRTRITQVAEGNPLFVEEMLRMLVDENRLVREGDDWVAAGGLTDVHVPPTITALLSARLDRLSHGERTVLEAASVAGKEFHRGAVTALLSEADRADLDAHLRSLVRKELVSPERSTLTGQDAYRFRHMLIRDAAYDAVPKSARSEHHRAFAGWLEAVAGERVAEQEEIVGYHLERAYRYRMELGLPEDSELRLGAGRALGSAGMRALDRGDIRAALDLLAPAADLAAGDRAALQILDGLAAALDEAGDWEEAETVLARLAEAARIAGDPVFTMRARLVALRRAVFANPDSVDIDEADALAEEALRTFRAHDVVRFQPSALLWLGSFALLRGDTATALSRAGEALEIAVATGDRLLVSTSLGSVLQGLTLGPTPLSAALERADDLLATFGDDRLAVPQINSMKAWINAGLGRPDAARANLAASRAFAGDLGSVYVESTRQFVEGDLARWAGDVDQAVTLWRGGLAAAEELGDKVNPGFISLELGRLLLDGGREAETGQPLAALDALSINANVWAAAALSIRSVVAARSGGIEEASRLSDAALAMIGPMDLLAAKGDVALDRAEVLRLAGRLSDARASASDARAMYGRKEYAIGTRRARAMLERLGLPEG